MLNLMKLESRIVLDGAAVAGALDHAADHDDAQGFDNDSGEMNVQEHQKYNTEGDTEFATAVADAAALLADSNELDRRAEAPVVTVTPSVSGDEDTIIPLTINVEFTNGSDTLRDITISGVPAGAELSAGVNNDNGSWTLTQNQLAGLTLTPPEHSDRDFILTVSATTEDGDSETATDAETINVTLNAVADKPILNITNIKGLEKDAIPLNIIAPSLADKDGSETLGDIIISGVPSGVTLSAGTYDASTGTWSVSSDQLGSLTLTSPVENSFTLTVSVTATESENGDSATTAKNMLVTVDPKADAPIINVVSDTSGNEDTAIPLTIQPPEKTDMDETLSDITISGVPPEATLSAGTYNEADNTWTLTAAQLEGLTITPVLNSDADFDLTVSVTSTEPVGGDSATTQETIRVTVNAVADRPDLAVSDTVSGNEGEAIPLSINSPSLTDTDGSESIQGNSVTISGVPDGAVLSAGVDNGKGTWTVSTDQLQGLTITPADKNDFTLTVSATSVEESNQDTATATATIDVVVDPGVNPPELILNDTSGNEDEAIGLDIKVKTENLSEITISGVPAEAKLSAGTYDENEGVWKLDSAAELVGLNIDPPENFSGEISLTVSATSADGENTATATGSLEVTVIAVADKPELNVVSNVSGNKGEPISLSINSPSLTDTDGSESIKGNSVTISGVPETASLSAGVNNGDGKWTVHVNNLSGLTVTSSEKGTLNLTVSATSVEESNQDEATETSIIRVNVNPTAEPPVIILDDTVTGNEDESIPLDISINVSDSSSEIISDITISGVPAGAELSAGIDNNNGSWTLTQAQLSGLTITPALNSDRDFSLTVSAISRETETGNEATATENIDVTVIAVADDPILNVVNNVTGKEKEAIGLDINAPLLVDTDGSESIFGDSVVISGVPSDAVLSAGTDNGNGSWTVNIGDLQDLTITTTNDNDFALTVRATSVEDENGDTASVEEVINVTVKQTVSTPIPGPVDTTGYEDTDISLTINPQAANPDSETLSDITIYDVPAGATLSAGTYNEQDGTWTLTASELQGLTITPPPNSDEDFNLRVSVTATNTQTGEKATGTEILKVTVLPVTDGPNLSVANSTGLENSDIKLNINSPTLIDTDGSEVLVGDYVTISGVPDNATLSAGEKMGDGTWQVSINQLSDLTIKPGDDNDIQLVVSATAKELEGESLTVSKNILVTVYPGADGVDWNVDGSPDMGDEYDSRLSLTDTAFENMKDKGVPQDVIDQLQSLKDKVFSDKDDKTAEEQFTDALKARLGEELAAQYESVILEDAHYPYNSQFKITDESLTDIRNEGVPEDIISQLEALKGNFYQNENNFMDALEAAIGEEQAANYRLSILEHTTTDYAPIDLNIGIPQLIDPNETLSDIIISGVPAGAELSAGTDNGDGTWTLTSDQLAGLTITPPAYSGDDFTLEVSVTSSESEADGGDTNTTTKDIDIKVNALANQPNIDVQDANIEEDKVETDAEHDARFEKDYFGEGQGALVIPLDFRISTPSGVDTDGSEETDTYIVISNLPEGATLSAGTDMGDGTWEVPVSQIDGLNIIIATPYDRSVYEGPFVITDETITEVSRILNDIGDGSICIAGQLEALKDQEYTNFDDFYNALLTTLGEADTTDYGSFIILNSATYKGTTLNVSVTSRERETVAGENQDDDTVTIEKEIDFGLKFWAEVPTLSFDSNPEGTAGEPIKIDLEAAPSDKDLDGSESLNEVTLASLDAPDGTVVMINGVVVEEEEYTSETCIISESTERTDVPKETLTWKIWTIPADQIDNVTITAPENFKGDFTLEALASSTESANNDLSPAAFPAAIKFTITPPNVPPDGGHPEVPEPISEVVRLIDIPRPVIGEQEGIELGEVIFPGPILPRGEIRHTNIRFDPPPCGDAELYKCCTLEEALRIGCRLAPALDPDSRLCNITWDYMTRDLGWEPPFRVVWNDEVSDMGRMLRSDGETWEYFSEELDLFNQLFMQGPEGESFNDIEAGELAEVYGMEEEQEFAEKNRNEEHDIFNQTSMQNETFNTVGPGELLKVFLEGREELADIPPGRWRDDGGSPDDC
ncbi:MAG: hypothetical protein GY795_08480 [Desulfobacterales bacterium]|nr:hypothetical protein [Desulfobacterales bacterium]